MNMASQTVKWLTIVSFLLHNNGAAFVLDVAARQTICARRQRFHFDAAKFGANRHAIASAFFLHHTILLFGDSAEEERWLLDIIE